MPVSHVAPGYHTVTPYITVRGGAKAIEFYKRAFGAAEVMRFEGPGGVVAHAEIEVCGSRVMLADEMPEWGNRGPETLGGARNWDYRFVWLRDAAFTLEALHAVGHVKEADAFMSFLKRVCRHEGGGHLQIMYGIDGRRDLEETVLEHLSGYMASRPVRVGNGSAGQLQLDVYGEVMQTAAIWRRDHPMTEGTWRVLRGLVEWVARNWQLPDSSIWEVRGGARHYVFSKVMSWVALDRGIQMAEELGLPGDVEFWRLAREELFHDVMSRGWSDRYQSFVQAYGNDALDAAALAIPMVGFLPWDHPRVISTVDAIARELTSADGELVYRYRYPDGLEGEEGAFSICTFWLAQDLAMTGRPDTARSASARISWALW